MPTPPGAGKARGRLALLAATIALATLAADRGRTQAAEHLSHGRFKGVAIYTPSAEPKSVVLFLSGDSGFTADLARAAEALKAHGALVAGIDLPTLARDFDADEADCIFPDGDLENLSHFLQAYYRLPRYLAPFLLGYRSGANLAYGALAQAPAGTFAGALTLGFCATPALRKPLCKGSGIAYAHPSGAAPAQFSPIDKLGSPWVLLEGERNPACAAGAPRAFIAHLPGAALADLPRSGAQAGSEAWLAPLLAAFDTLVARAARRLPPPPAAALVGLPVIEVPARRGAPARDAFAIILSGDGGWAGLDKEVAGALAADGIPAVGLDSLRYFWSARTPAGLAADLERMILYYAAQLHKNKVLLIGYSQGADVLPFAVNRLPEAVAAHVALTALIGMSEHALFEFHLSSWISDDRSGPLTMPEVNRMGGAPVLCIYGAQESDSLCPKLDARRVRIIRMQGGHHFDGDYTGLARAILAAEPPGENHP